MGSTTEMVPHATRTSLNGANTCVPYVVKQSSKMCVRKPQKKSWTQPLKSVSGRFHVPLKYRRWPCRQKIHPANGTYSTTGKNPPGAKIWVRKFTTNPRTTTANALAAMAIFAWCELRYSQSVAHPKNRDPNTVAVREWLMPR